MKAAVSLSSEVLNHQLTEGLLTASPGPPLLQTSTCYDIRQAPLRRGDTHVRIVR